MDLSINTVQLVILHRWGLWIWPYTNLSQIKDQWVRQMRLDMFSLTTPTISLLLREGEGLWEVKQPPMYIGICFGGKWEAMHCDSNLKVAHDSDASCFCSQSCRFGVSSYPWVDEEDPSIPRLTLDHADVIGSISNSQGDDPLVPLHQLHHLGFLHRSDPAADDCFTQTGHVEQNVLEQRLQSVSLPWHHKPHTS